MKLHQLRAIVAICESGSIQEASRLLHISQPALSKSIKELESELGVPLLVRSNRGITATSYGEHLVRRARLVVEEGQEYGAAKRHAARQPPAHRQPRRDCAATLA